MLVLLPGKVLRGAMHRDACANLTAIKALRGSPEGQTKACFTLRRGHLTHGTYVFWLSDLWVESKSNVHLVDHCDGKGHGIAELTCGNYLSFDIKV